MGASVVVFICKIVRAEPPQMKQAAGKSYFQINFSPSMYQDIIMVTKIAREQVVVNRVMSAKGSINTWPKLPIKTLMNPPSNQR